MLPELTPRLIFPLKYFIACGLVSMMLHPGGQKRTILTEFPSRMQASHDVISDYNIVIFS